MARKFDDIFLRLCNAVSKQNNREINKRLHLLFPKKGDLRITKNYRAIILTTITAKVYNALLFDCIQPEIEKILSKIRTVSEKNRSPTS